MKLSSRDIAIIEDLLTQREQGKTNAELAKACGLKKPYYSQAFATMFSTLKSAGVNVPAAISRGEQMKRELAEFRAWKAAQAKQTESTLIPRAAQPNGLFRPNGSISNISHADAVRVTGL
jgi:hypothetical protein